MGDTSDLSTPTPNELAWGRLLTAARETNVKKVIGAYHPESTHEVNIKALEKFTIDLYLKPCVSFLGIPSSMSAGLL